MNDNDSKLKLAFYDASDGPRIMLFGSLEADFISLQELFRLMSHSNEWVEVDRQPFIRTFGAIRLRLKCCGGMFTGPDLTSIGLRRTSSPTRFDFEWVRTAEGWEYLAELIDTLVSHPDPGHQYLSAYPKEDAIFVVSKGEYDDSVLTNLE